MKTSSKRLKLNQIADVLVHLAEFGYHVTLTKNETFMTCNVSGTTLMLYGDELGEKVTTRQNIIDMLIDQNTASQYEPIPCEECEGGGGKVGGAVCEVCLGDGYLMRKRKDND